MSDARLRELERRWKETRAVEDEAAYLLERVRVGDLTRERLELAAYCGHEGALRAAGIPAGPLEDLSDLLVHISRWGRMPVLVGVRGVIDETKEVWQRSPTACEAIRRSLIVESPVLHPHNYYPALDPEESPQTWTATFATFRFYEATIADTDAQCIVAAQEALNQATLALDRRKLDFVQDLDLPPSETALAHAGRIVRATVGSWALNSSPSAGGART